MRKMNRILLFILSAIWALAAVVGVFKIFGGGDVATILKTLAMVALSFGSYKWAKKLNTPTN